MSTPPTLTLAGRPIPAALDHIRRYCGLPWSRGRPEVWAYQYFDATHCYRNREPAIGPDDVLAVAALHPGFTRRDLAFFVEAAEVLAAAVAVIPAHVDLADAADDVVERVENLDLLAEAGGVGLSLVSKVVHGKRPRLVPMLDRALTDWYHGATGRRGTAAWRPTVRALRADLAHRPNREALQHFAEDLAAELPGPVPSHLRLADIGIWMDQQ